MGRKTISVDKKNGTIKFPEFDSDNGLVYDLFDSLGTDEYDETFRAMLHIGALAMMDDRISHLINSAEKEIFPQLEKFKLHFVRRKTQFEKSTQKGDIAEDDIVDILSEYVDNNDWTDYIVKSGSTKGKLTPPTGPNKTGDVLATIEFTPNDGSGVEKTMVGIEVKFEQGFSIGDPEEFNVESGKSDNKGFMGSTIDTAWSQLLETKANRDSPFSIIVFDQQLVSAKMKQAVNDVLYLPGIPGFIVIIDSQSGNYSNLLVTYKIAREMAIHHSRGELDVDPGVIELIAKRILHYLGDAKKVAGKVKKHAEAAIKLNTDVQKLLQHSISHAEYTEEFLQRYLTSKKLTPVDYAEFYFAHPVAEKLRESNAEEDSFAKEQKKLL